MSDGIFIPSTGRDFIPSPTTPASGPQDARKRPLANRWGIDYQQDPDAVIAAALDRAEKDIDRIVKDRVHMALWDSVHLPEKPKGEGIARYAIESAVEELGLKARLLRGRRLVHRLALEEVEGILLDIQNDPNFQNHPAESRAARMLIASYLERQQDRDEFAARRQASAGAPVDPPVYKAPDPMQFRQVRNPEGA